MVSKIKSCLVGEIEIQSTIILRQPRDEGKITDEEIHRAVFSMSLWNAPGPNGFPFGFYQNTWNVVGLQV